jgi:hypothetical protein
VYTASNTTIDEPAKAGVRPASAATRKARRARARDASERAFLEHYVKRLDPEVAASSTEEQRSAIMTMFGARGIAEHAVEVRHSVPLPGGRRFYLVFLCGRERRSIARLFSQGKMSRVVDILWYLGLGALFLVPVLALLAFGGL